MRIVRAWRCAAVSSFSLVFLTNGFRATFFKEGAFGEDAGAVAGFVEVESALCLAMGFWPPGFDPLASSTRKFRAPTALPPISFTACAASSGSAKVTNPNPRLE